MQKIALFLTPISLFLLILAVYCYLTALELLREETDWIGYLINAIKSCIYILAFTLLYLAGFILLSIALNCMEE